MDNALSNDVEIVPIDSIQPWPDNPNTHTPENIDALRRAYEEFGQDKALVVWRDERYGEKRCIICGNGFYLAMKAAGGTHVKIIDRSHWGRSEAERRALADNELAFLSRRDDVKAAAILERARKEGKPVHGVDTAKADEIMAKARAALPENPPEDAEPQVNRAEELREQWGVELGQVWRAGDHFIICGDCRESDTWKLLLSTSGVEKVNGVFTSPPYAEQRKEQYGGVPASEYIEWWDAVQTNTRASLANDGSFFVNIKEHCEQGQRVLYCKKLVVAMVERWGWRWVDTLYWDKMRPAPHDIKDVRRFYDAVEPVVHYSIVREVSFYPDNVRVPKSSEGKKRSVYENRRRRQRERSGNLSPKYSVTGSGYHNSVTILDEGMRYPDNVIAVAPYDGFSHAAAFPVALPSFFIKAFSDAGDVWLDPFLGSGTTIVAAHNNERRGLGIERLPKYVAVTLQRLSDMGLKPERVR